MGCTRDLCISALLLIFNFFYLFNAADIITSAQFISDSQNESILSSNGNFRLGFFSPGKSRNRYVGIWPNKISKRMVVWVANRETPIRNSEGILKIAEGGNLAIFGHNKTTPLWSTNVSMPERKSMAKIFDSGNLILVAEDEWSDSETIIWQSFDYPTDTIIPGMKFGMNRKTGLIQALTSWKSTDDPAPGEFSCMLDPLGSPQFFIYQGSLPRYRCGPWNGRNLNGLPDVTTRLRMLNVDYSKQIDLINYTFVMNDNEIYVEMLTKKDSPFPVTVLEPTGVAKRMIWHESKKWAIFWMAPLDLCDEYSRCGANAICHNENTMTRCECLPGFVPLYPHKWSLECAEKRKVGECGKGYGEGFVRVERLKLPDARNSRVYCNMSLKECEKKCLKNCNCTGYASSNVNEDGRGCMAWYGELKDMRQYNDGQDFYLRVDAVELAANARKNSKKFLANKSTVAFIIVPVVMEMLIIAACFYYWWTRKAGRKGQKKKQRRDNSLLLESATSLPNHKNSVIPSANSRGESGNIELTLFDVKSIVAATDNFSSARKLGQGGFGPVYKGQLPDGQEIAVKRLLKNSHQGIEEFENEVLLIGKLQHRNLVRLLGYCVEGDENMLIYEFMPNKSLDCFIFDQSRKMFLDWKTRFDIILGIARGILYLHEDSRLRIIHRDLKTSNILLDGEMKPRISDFGIARLLGGDQTQANTKRVVGTFGYMSPEYALGGFFSTKSDMFSFGVVLLEIISGKKNRGLIFHDDPSSNLIRYTWELWRDDKALETVESCIVDSCPVQEVVRCIQVGLLCVQDDASKRPTMSTAIFMLTNETQLPSPKQSTFSFRRTKTEPDSSINEVTITTFSAR